MTFHKAVVSKNVCQHIYLNIYTPFDEALCSFPGITKGLVLFFVMHAYYVHNCPT